MGGNLEHFSKKISFEATLLEPLLKRSETLPVIFYFCLPVSFSSSSFFQLLAKFLLTPTMGWGWGCQQTILTNFLAILGQFRTLLFVFIGDQIFLGEEDKTSKICGGLPQKYLSNIYFVP